MTRRGWMVWDIKRKWFASWFVYKTKTQALMDCWKPGRKPILVSFIFKKPMVKP